MITKKQEMHPALQAAIRAAEQAYAQAEELGHNDQEAYDLAWDCAYAAARTSDLNKEDAKIVATSAASDGNADPEEGYKDIIPPYTRSVRMVVQKRDGRPNHARKKRA
jgi:hypothetical protein